MDIKCGRKYTNDEGESWTCEGIIELSSKIYFDVQGHRKGAFAMINEVDESHLNDTLDGVAFNIESELYCNCADCGHEYIPDFSKTLMKRIKRSGA